MTSTARRVALSGTVVTLIAFAFLGCRRPAGETVAGERHGIVTLAPHLTETVFALGQGERVVGVGSFCDYPAEVAALPKLGGYIDPDLERITLLNPGQIILPGRQEKVAAYARLHGVPVLHVHMDSLETIDTGIAQLGEALGCASAATALRTRIKNELQAVRAAVAPEPRPKVLIITGRSQHGLSSLFTANGRSFVSELIETAGGDNVYRDAEETYFEASKETVVTEAPEVIVEFHAGEVLSEAEQRLYIEDWRQLPSLPAVKTGRVHLILESHALRPGPRVAEIARIIARLLHPEADVPQS